MLDDLRMEIDRLDEELLLLLSKRMAISKKIGEAKERKGIPTLDEARETAVRRRWLDIASRLGLPQGLVESLLRTVLAASLGAQARLPGVSIAVAGGGRMANALLSVLGGSAVSTDFFGEPALDPCTAFARSDYIIIATHPSILGNRAFLDSLSCAAGKTISDVFSVKGVAFKELERLSMEMDFNYVSLHPLFSDQLDPAGEVMVVVPSSTSGSALSMVMDLWGGLGFKVVMSDADSHDRAMAITQVIHHMYLSALLRALRDASHEFGIDYSQFITHSLKSTLSVAERIVNQGDLVREIQSMNRYAALARRVGLEAMIKTAEELGGVA